MVHVSERHYFKITHKNVIWELGSHSIISSSGKQVLFGEIQDKGSTETNNFKISRYWDDKAVRLVRVAGAALQPPSKFQRHSIPTKPP